LLRAAAALEKASDSGKDSRFLSLAQDFVGRYPQVADGQATLAEALQRNGRYGEAIRAVDRAVRLGLDETQAHMLRADIYDDAGEAGKAIPEFTALTQSRMPELRQISLLSRARLLLQIGDSDQALRDANDAIATLPDEAAYTVRGHVHRNRGDLEACLRDYTRAIRLCPDIPELLENRAELYELMGRTAEARSDRAATRRMSGGRRPF
jgi:tetratricopeptide (TPR) repeat protein